MMLVDDPFRDGEPQAGAAGPAIAARIQPNKGYKDAFGVSGGNPWTVVVDMQDEVEGGRCELHIDARFGVAHGIHEKIL